MSTKPKVAKRKHYFMICAQIVFKVEGNEEANVMSMNGIITQENTNITRDSLGQAQKTVQINFHQRMADVKFEIIDVIIQNIMHLGHMLQSEFMKLPEGMELKQTPVATAASEVPATMAAMQNQEQGAANG